MSQCGKICLPARHITIIDTIVYIKIKSRQLRSNGYQKYHAKPYQCITLVYNNHWADKIFKLPYIDPMSYPLSYTAIPHISYYRYIFIP